MPRTAKVLGISAALAAFWLIAGGAIAAEVTKPAAETDVDRIIRLVQDEGYSAKEDKEDSVPAVIAKFEGANTEIELYNCADKDKAKGCTVLSFHSGFDVKGIDLAAMNDWNANHWFGMAYLGSDKSPGVQLAVSLVGATDENITDDIEWWDGIITEFTKTIGWK